MFIFLLILLVALNTSVWPINRIILKDKSDPMRYGTVISFFALLFSFAALLITNAPLFDSTAVFWGFFMAIGYAFGYCLLIMKCLEIGPTGLTVLFNNLGLVFPTIIGLILFSKGKTPDWKLFLGLGLTVVAMVFITKQTDDAKISKKWTVMALAAWLLSGVCMTSHFMGSQFISSPLTFSFWTFLFSFIFLFTLSIIFKIGLPKKREIMGGAYNGAFQMINLVLNFILLQNLPAAVVFPIGTAAPIFIMLIISTVFFKEKLSKIKIFACAAGIIGIVLLSVAANT